MRHFDYEAIAKAVSDTLSKDFRIIKIVNVNVTSDIDCDGEQVLRIEVVFDGALKRDAKHLVSAVRKLRPELSKLHADLFPLLSFVSILDKQKAGTQTARVPLSTRRLSSRHAPS